MLVKVLKSMLHIKGDDNREVSGTFMPTLIVKELKFSVEYGRVLTTLTVIKHRISFLV